MKATAPSSSGRKESGSCLCGAVLLQIDFPAFWGLARSLRGEPERPRHRVRDLYRLLVQARTRGEGPKKHPSLRGCQDGLDPKLLLPVRGSTAL
jgi:hypothetical protein